MIKTREQGRLSGLNIFLLFLACLASLGTLAPDERTGRPRGMAVFTEERQGFTLTIEPAEGLVPDFEPGTEHVLDFRLFDVPTSTKDTAIWTLVVEGNDTFSMSGDFRLSEENQFTEETTRMGELEVDVGSFCEDESSEEDNCIPCSVEAGCSLFIELDFCQTLPDREVHFEVHVQPVDQEYSIECHKDGDTGPCDLLNDWVTLTNAPLTTSLCGEAGE